MSQPINVPVVPPLSKHSPTQMPLKSCFRKHSARSNLHTRFDMEPSLFALDTTPELIQLQSSPGDHSSTRILNSTTVDTPVIAFSNPTYAGSPVSSPVKSASVQNKSQNASSSRDQSSQLLSKTVEQFFTLSADQALDDMSSSSASTDSATFLEVPNDVYMACSVPYVARSDQEINLAFADRVKVVEMSPDWCYVINLTTPQSGYVPAASLMSVQQFLQDLQFLSGRKKFS